jgi:cytidylate kinase
VTDVPRELIVAIDGPSGAGKSTLSRELAHRLGYLNIDTGAMYRSVALAVQREGATAADEAALTALCQSLRIAFRQGDDGFLQTLLNDEDVSNEIRSPDISQLTPQVAAVAGVRSALVEQQRRMGDAGGVVLEGRDIGSVVFPHAEVKIFLLATAEERGLRRFRELREKGVEVDLLQTIRDVEERDQADMNRAVAPLVQAEDALVVETTGMDIPAVLDRLVTIVEEKRRELGLSPLTKAKDA